MFPKFEGKFWSFEAFLPYAIIFGLTSALLAICAVVKFFLLSF